MFAAALAISAASRTALRQVLAIDDRAGRMALRQDLLIVRELAVDEPADEVDALEVEQDLVLARGEDHVDRVVDVGQDPAELVERAGRDDDARLLDRVERRDRLDRDPVVVGRRQGQLVPFEAAQDPGQDRTGLVAGRRERRLVERLPERLLGDPGRRALAGGRDGREFLGIDALDVGLEAARPDPQRVAGLELEVDPLAGRQAGHDVGQELGRDRDRAVRRRSCREPSR